MTTTENYQNQFHTSQQTDTTMSFTINSVTYTAGHSSPKSVIHHSTDAIVEQLVLEGNEIRTQHSMKIRLDSQREPTTGHCENDNGRWTGMKRPRQPEPWVCPASKKSKLTTNPVQTIVSQVVERIRLGSQRRDGKNPLSLASGDAIAAGNMPACSAAIEFVVKATLENPHAAAYSNACGTNDARSAIAKFHSYPEAKISSDDVIVANGCSGALDLALNSLLDVGTTLLVPQPGFPLYEEIAKSIGANVVHYHLNPEQNWECDIEHLKSIMSSNHDVRAMVINNPSSTTGAVFSEEHLSAIARFANTYQIPILSDEIYGDLTFGSNKFIPMALIAARQGGNVPVITASGISKQFLLPGWRVGWLTFHDNKYHSLWQVKAGATRLAQLNHGASNLAQAAIPTLLDPSTPGLADWRETLRLTLQERCELLCGRLRNCPGLHVLPAQGAMYATFEIDTTKLDVEHDVEFAMRLVDEENVFVLPGTAMGVQNIIRVSFCSPENILDAAARRIESFCRRNVKYVVTPVE